MLQCLGHLESKTGDAEEARSLFKRATSADPKHAYSWQVHVQQECSVVGPNSGTSPSVMEGSNSHLASRFMSRSECQLRVQRQSAMPCDVAPRFCRLQSAAASGSAVQAWGVLEARLGNTAAARRVFERGAARGPPHPPLLSAWARMEVVAPTTMYRSLSPR